MRLCDIKPINSIFVAESKTGLELKKEILLALGKTPIIKDQKLFIEPNE